MSKLWRLVAAASVALLGGCVSDGVGTDLATVSLKSRTDAQDAYVAAICRQAGGGSEQFCQVGNWTTFVYAGMNDIDQRCDEYLSWLDQRKRAVSPSLLQIAATQDATQTILRESGVGLSSIGIVAAAFGLARETFTNVNARLLIELDHSTVQMVVSNKQTRFRTELSQIGPIGSRPQAIYALRQYLRICMPFTIVSDINTTVTTFEAAGANALAIKDGRPLVVAGAIAAAPVLPRDVVTPRVTIVRPAKEELDEYYEFFEDPRKYSRKGARKILSDICVSLPKAVSPDVRLITRQKIEIYQQSIYRPSETGKVTGILRNVEVDQLGTRPECNPALHENAYEALSFPSGLSAEPTFIEDLRAKLGADATLPANPSDKDIRAALARLRMQNAEQLLSRNLKKQDQLTPDLFRLISRE